MEFEKYEHMSPFEVKNELIEIAKENARKSGGDIYNAGRGNPNFLNVPVRKAFSYLNLFITSLADDQSSIKDVGLRPKKEGIYKRLMAFLDDRKEEGSILFLRKAIEYAIERFKFDKDEFIFSLSDAALGDFYPMPPRIFPPTEKIVSTYVNQVLGLSGDPKVEDFDLFATEGGSAAMVYIFKSLRINRVVRPKDKIAIITPIFSPYLEMPLLSDFDLVEILLESKEDLGWQISDNDIKKLEDPRIKAIYLVNPANPTSIALSDHIISKIVDFVKTKRRDLVILTDTVYATFIDKFHSLVKEVPENTICVYSFSKYFGVTGWRLGVIMMHKNNLVDKLIRELPEEDKRELDKRYSTVAVDPRGLPFIERLELDSRDEALAHTGGLSGPQQSIMTLFALYGLMDRKERYKIDLHSMLARRITDLFENLGVDVPEEKGNTYYYVLIDLRKIAKRKYGEEFAIYFEKNINPFEFLFKLARERSTILLPGKGFAGPKWSVRVSLANLPDDNYPIIGKNISDILEDYYKRWKS